MTVLDTLNFVAFNPLQNNNPIAVRRHKQINSDAVGWWKDEVRV